MAKPIEISLVANTRAFTAGTKNAADALDEVADSLDDLAKESSRSADRTGDNIADGIEDGTDKASTEVERLNKKFRELATESRSSSSKVGDELGDSVKRGTGQASESVREFGNEARQNIGETFSSFRGDVSDFGQIVQDTLGGLSTSLGGIPGIALTAAGAAGIGLILSALEQGAEDSEQFKAKVSELTTALIDAGRSGVQPIEFISDKLKELAANTEDGETSLKDLQDIARDAKAPFRDLAQAYAGNSEGLDDLIRASEDYYKALDNEQTGLDLSTDAGNRRNKQIAEELDGRERYIAKLGETKTAVQEAEEQERLYLLANGPETQAKADLISSINDAYDEAAGAASDFINKETGLFDVGPYIEAMQKREDALKNYQENLATTDLSGDARAYLEGLGYESASLMLQGYKDATPEQRAELGRIWREAGQTDSGTYSSTFAAGVPSTIADTKVRVGVDTSAYDRWRETALRGINITATVRMTEAAAGRGGSRVD